MALSRSGCPLCGTVGGMDADDCMDAGGRATQDAKADDCMDAGGRATQDAKADVERAGMHS